jgi:glyoxylase-like metal-dependent hydrolase (beta-lactamase superfamily II)
MVVAGDVVRICTPLPFAEPDHINCYVIRAGDEHLLVDTGMRGSEAAIDGALRAHAIELDGVVITHGHPDHWGLADRYSGGVVRAHADIRSQLAWAQQDLESASMHGLPPGRVLDRELFEVLIGYGDVTGEPPLVNPLAEGDRLGEWQVLVTPGHAPGHICLYRERDMVLISGDHLLPLITPNIHLTEEMPDAVADYLDALRRVGAMGINLVLPAHGEPFTDGRGRAAELIAHHERRLARLEALLDTGGPAGTARLSEQLFNSVEEPAEKLMAEMETYAHLEHLRLRGRVALADDDLWSLAE